MVDLLLAAIRAPVVEAIMVEFREAGNFTEQKTAVTADIMEVVVTLVVATLVAAMAVITAVAILAVE